MILDKGHTAENVKEYLQEEGEEAKEQAKNAKDETTGFLGSAAEYVIETAESIGEKVGDFFSATGHAAEEQQYHAERKYEQEKAKNPHASYSERAAAGMNAASKGAQEMKEKTQKNIHEADLNIL